MLRIHKILFLFAMIMLLHRMPCHASNNDSVQNMSTYDSLRVAFMNSIEYCELLQPTDTLLFIKQALSAFVNYDNSSSFQAMFFCFEPGYMNLIDPDHKMYPVEELYLKRDIRWILLFYIERYLLNKKNEKVDKYCKISLFKKHKHRVVDFYGEKSSANLITIYRKLIRTVHRKSYAKQFKKNRQKDFLEAAGYEFEVSKAGAYQYDVYRSTR